MASVLKPNMKLADRLILFLGTVAFLYRTVVEFHKIAWGTGNWWGEFSLKWGVTFIIFSIFCVLALYMTGVLLWRPANWPWRMQLLVLRSRLGVFRWLWVMVAIAFPIWLLQYTTWGVVFSGINLRLLIWCITVLIVGFLLGDNQNDTLSFSSFSLALLLTGAAITLAVPFRDVTNYPFSLGWSEGNRLWDYSLLFGKNLYDFLPERPPVAYLDIGRQLSGGLPFLFTNVSIFEARLWLALMEVIPYLILGWIAFWLPESKRRLISLLAGLWAFIFLTQGPIHTPLLWCAVLVALAWRKPMWLALPLVILSSYFAQASRITYTFAPAMWVGMLELSSASLEQMRLQWRNWRRALEVALAGLVGGLLMPFLLSQWKWLLTVFQSNGISSEISPPSSQGLIIFSVTRVISRQPLLWYRLLPNATYGNGILLGILLAAGPLVICLCYLATTHRWILNLWQKLAVVLPLLAFLIVGLVVSSKIGGGGDLHNLDMFIIGMMFAAALAWRAYGARWLTAASGLSMWMRLVAVIMIAIPVIHPLRSLYPSSFAEEVERLAILIDKENPKLLDSLPSDASVKNSLQTVKDQVKAAQAHGEVLFMDQRQLLTFGFIQDVPLVSEYEKKLLMDKALSGNMAYFKRFYEDLAGKRFSLIISDPLRESIKDIDYQFGEENNAWVKWVATPVLCYYEPVENLSEVNIQLLIPKQGSQDCSESLPQE